MTPVRAAALALLLALPLCAAFARAQASSPVVVAVDGKPLPASAVVTQGGRIFVALRPLARRLGADIQSDAGRKTITITTLLRQLVLHEGDRAATLNGQAIWLLDPPTRMGQRIVLPLRAIAQAFGAHVAYDGQTHTARISFALHAVVGSGPHTPSPNAATTTVSGTVVAVSAREQPPVLQMRSAQTDYTVTVPVDTSIAFRDIHGSFSGNGVLSQVHPGDQIIVTLDADGGLISMADIFASINGTIAAIADQSMVLTSGRVIAADPNGLAVTIDGKDAVFADLRPGDRASIRANPISGKVRDVVAFRPGGFSAAASSTPQPGQSGSAGVRITGARSDARALRAGQVLTVVAEGTPGADALFDLGNIIIDNPMREVRPGRYEGRFAVTVGTNLTDAPILVRLAKNGQTAVAECPQPITIVTTPPTVLDAAPSAGARINSVRPNIVATFLTVGGTGMDPDSLRMILNGRDVTSQTTRDPSFITYYPQADLGTRTVVVEVKGTDIAGNPLDYTWSFEVAPQ